MNSVTAHEILFTYHMILYQYIWVKNKLSTEKENVCSIDSIIFYVIAGIKPLRIAGLVTLIIMLLAASNSRPGQLLLYPLSHIIQDCSAGLKPKKMAFIFTQSINLNLGSRHVLFFLDFSEHRTILVESLPFLVPVP